MQTSDPELKRVYHLSSVSQKGKYTEIEIHVGLDREFTETEKRAFENAGQMIRETITRENYCLDEEYCKQGAEETQKLIDLFGDRKIYVERRQNGYWPDDVHNPWLIVTTDKGRITIGWRKRVINIDWTDSSISADPKVLFAEEDVTKSELYGTDKFIHAWGYEKAKEYLDKLLAQ